MKETARKLSPFWCARSHLAKRQKSPCSRAKRDSGYWWRSVKDYAIFALDTEGKVASWNIGAERIKGYRPEEIIGKHFSVFYPPEDIAAGKPENELQVAAAEGRFEDVGGWRVRKDGSRFFANVVISAIRDADGVLRGFTKVTRDITDRMRAEEAVRQLSGHILRLQDDERRRIARDLHDSTAQLLTALSMNLSLAARRPSVAGDEQASRLIRDSEALANQASDEVRNTSHLPASTGFGCGGIAGGDSLARGTVQRADWHRRQIEHA